MNRPRYLRFVTTRRHRDSGASEGLFAAAYDLRRAGAFAAHEAVWFQQTVGWFERHVKVPKRVDLDLLRGPSSRIASSGGGMRKRLRPFVT